MINKVTVMYVAQYNDCLDELLVPVGQYISHGLSE